jgi:hypothetical protein
MLNFSLSPFNLSAEMCKLFDNKKSILIEVGGYSMSRLRTRYGKRLVWHLSKINMTIGLLLAVFLFSSCTATDTNQNSSTPPAQTNSSPGKAEIPNASTPAAAPSNSPPKSGNYLAAAPNPVPASLGPGTTMISWHSTNIPSEQVHVYVVGIDGKEALFATGSEGSQAAPWITANAPVEFRLYSGSGAKKKLLDKITVTMNK